VDLIVVDADTTGDASLTQNFNHLLEIITVNPDPSEITSQRIDGGPSKRHATTVAAFGNGRGRAAANSTNKLIQSRLSAELARPAGSMSQAHPAGRRCCRRRPT